jgi:hypothetical protein
MKERNEMREVKRSIKQETVEFDTEEYVSFLRELAQWAMNEADVAEFRDEYNEEFDDEYV